MFLLPLLVGWYVVQSLRDENGGGEADRAVFGGTAIAIAVGLLVWNLGFREGATGRTSGKGWVGLVTRDAKTKQPIGVRRALRRPFDRTGIEVVRESTAREEGFEELARDNSVGGATRRRRLIGLAVLTVLLALVMLASIAVGARPLTFAEIFHAIFSSDGTQTDIIVRTLRAPRTILGLVVASHSVSPALIQGHTRNPLADAGLLGLNAGAAFFVVMAIYLFGFTAPSQYLWFAFAGSFVASIVVFGLSSIGNGGASPLSLALAGAAVAFFLQAMTNAVIILDQTSLDAYRFWVVGSVSGRGFDVLWQVLPPFLILGLVIALASTPGLNVLSLGEDVAKALGTNIAFSRTLGIIAITLLTGAATAACGPIAFIGLVVPPHVARAITGPDYRWLVPYAACSVRSC